MKTNHIILFVLTFYCHHLFAKPEKTADFIPDLKKQDFYEFYKNYLTKESPSHKGPLDEKKWSLEKISKPEAVIKAARPGRKYYNEVIIWYGTEKNKIGFRPIDTPTDCSSGCSPVVFHLVINALGKTLSIVEGEEPLRKKYHVPFTKEDKEKLLKTAQTFPEILTAIDHPLELTESSSKQTWTVYSDVLVKNGAYTSYVVYNVAKVTSELLSPKKEKTEKEKKNEEKLTEIFKSPVDNEENLLAIMKKMKDFALITDSFLAKKVLLDNLLKATFFVFTKYPDNLDSTKIKNLVKDYYTPFTKEYSGFMQNSFVNLLNNLIKKEKGRDFILALEEKYKGWKLLPKGLRSFLPFISQGLAKNKSYLKTKEKNLDKKALLEFCSLSSFSLKAYVQAFVTLKNKEEALKAYARLHVRFPKANFDDLTPLPKAWEKDKEAFENKETHEYAKVLSKEFHPLNKKLPSITGIKPYDKDKKKKIPEAKDGKQIFFFFAPWCGHCHEVITALAKNMPESFWKKTQLISVLSDDPAMLEKFVTYAKLKENAPLAASELIMLKETPENKAYYNDKLSLLAVPKIILTNPKGDIVDFSFRLDGHPERDLDREIKLIFSTLL